MVVKKPVFTLFGTTSFIKDKDIIICQFLGLKKMSMAHMLKLDKVDYRYSLSKFARE